MAIDTILKYSNHSNGRVILRFPLCYTCLQCILEPHLLISQINEIFWLSGIPSARKNSWQMFCLLAASVVMTRKNRGNVWVCYFCHQPIIHTLTQPHTRCIDRVINKNSTNIPPNPPLILHDKYWYCFTPACPSLQEVHLSMSAHAQDSLPPLDKSVRAAVCALWLWGEMEEEDEC